MKIFNSIGHFIAWVLGKATPVVQAIVAVDSSPIATAIASMLGPEGKAVQEAIQAIAGDVLKSFGAANASINEGNLLVNFDPSTVEAITKLHNDLAKLFGKPTVAAPPAA